MRRSARLKTTSLVIASLATLGLTYLILNQGLRLESTGTVTNARVSQSEERLTLQFRSTIPHTFTDGGRPGNGPGDRSLFGGPLFGHKGTRVGRLMAEGTVTSSGPPFDGYLVLLLSLDGRGSLVAEGRTQFESKDRHHGTLIITGGSGDFVGSSGVVERNVSNRGFWNLDLRLQRR